ncbi:Oidioi.mRNA.OKI2018_I69.PAR.g8841.t1.cds [Oikopleura dioica]|uniref:Oidioi.mRNA.OKI2018_I69.PAR.g8841.t1.cds n=1 Tax=Oikopleura dioica TaxID=34765 RepID=A0ABN7RN92_OIKDI|nr:Oidioi.mRNA.OKI2018_I69.PAR.g8841.t1.cds [Oikopleura dioica]
MLKIAQKDLEDKKKYRRKVQKRALLLANYVMKEDNNDLENDQQSEVKSEAEDRKCKVCFEKYDDDHPEAAIFPCGHKSCYNCLTSLTQKICPICRAEFTGDKILKLYS